MAVSGPEATGEVIERRTMKYFRCLILLAAVMTQICLSQSIAYYVDAVIGNDTNDGKSAETAWKTLANVNAQTFQPGDRIYLKSGSVWTGQLLLRGSGTQTNPIIVDMYDGTAKPRIDGNGIIGTATVYLNNGKFWEINNLEITNDAATGADRRGVLVAASNFGLVQHIYLKNLDIHDVKGLPGQDDKNKRTAGIGIETTSDGSVPTRYDDVLIEGCTIYNVDNTGIYTDNLMSGARSEYPGTEHWPDRCFTNVRIRKNIIHHIAKNAMIIRFFKGGVVENNVCYETALKTTGNTMYTSTCDGTIFQFNEGYLNRSPGFDGSMYDADLRSPNTIWQYSYSHDNAHGLFWTCTTQTDSNVVCRYNISQNDKGIIFCISYANTMVSCYNNTVYCGSATSPVILSERNGGDPGPRSYRFINNIIYNLSPNASYDFRASGYTRFFESNTFYGWHPANEPADLKKMATDPMLVNPGSGSLGIATLDGYKLKPGSPCINSGTTIPAAGGFDFWQNPVPSGGKTDRGAFEYPQSTGINDRLSNANRYLLAQNFPNPFNPDTNIEYRMPAPGRVSLVVYDLSGKSVRNLKDGKSNAGNYSERWDGTDDHGLPVASGVYYARLTSDVGVASVKMILIR
jgi:hypothetical protein